jgi:hypothetical protein
LVGGALVGIAVALIQRKPTELQLGQTAYDQLHELSELYRADIADYRTQRQESSRIEESLRDHLDGARIEIAALKRELELARIEVRQLRDEVSTLRQHRE